MHFDNISDPLLGMEGIHLPGEIPVPSPNEEMQPRDNSSTEKDVHVLFQPPNHPAPPQVMNQSVSPK